MSNIHRHEAGSKIAGAATGGQFKPHSRETPPPPATASALRPGAFRVIRDERLDTVFLTYFSEGGDSEFVSERPLTPGDIETPDDEIIRELAPTARLDFDARMYPNWQSDLETLCGDQELENYALDGVMFVRNIPFTAPDHLRVSGAAEVGNQVVYTDMANQDGRVWEVVSTPEQNVDSEYGWSAGYELRSGRKTQWSDLRQPGWTFADMKDAAH